MKRTLTILCLLIAATWPNNSQAQGCYANPAFAGQSLGFHPSGQMVTDCSGLNARKTFVGVSDTLLPIQVAGDILWYFDGFRVLQVEGLPEGMILQTDVENSATAQSPWGVWQGTGSVPTMEPAIGCINITGDQVAWDNASTGGPNNDGVHPITVIVDIRIAATEPDFSAVVPDGTWFSELAALGINSDTVSFELNVNEMDCGTELFVEPQVLSDNESTPECDGSVSVEVYNGTPPYQYSFSTGASGSDGVDELCPGIYTAFVTDVNGYEAQTTFAVSSSSNVYVSPATGGTPPNSDSLFASYLECDLDYNLPVDSFSIVDAITVGTDTCLVTWVVYQEGSPFTIITYYPFIDFNPTVFSLILYCQNGRSEAGVIQLYDYLDLSQSVDVGDRTIQELTVFPNPSPGLFNVNGIRPGQSIAVTDITGRVVYSSLSTSETARIDLRSIDAGIYVIQVNSENGIKNHRVYKK